MEKSGNTKNIAMIVIIAASVIGVVWIIYQLIEAKKEIQEVKIDLNKLLQHQLEQSQKPDKLKESLINLITFFKSKDLDIHEELKDALKRLEDNNEAEAARVITLVMESVLKAKAKEELNDWFVRFKSPELIKLGNLIDKFKSVGFFNEEESQLASMIREFRNEKSHKPNIEGNTSYNSKMLHVHVGVLLLYKCISD